MNTACEGLKNDPNVNIILVVHNVAYDNLWYKCMANGASVHKGSWL